MSGNDWKLDPGAYKGNPMLKDVVNSTTSPKTRSKSLSSVLKTLSTSLTNYIKVISLDDGIIPFHPYPFQQKLVKFVQRQPIYYM